MALKWAVYTMVFGFFIGADNGAHGAGFLLGAVIGLAVNPSRIKGRAPSAPIMILSIVSWLLVVGAFLACMIPLPSKLSALFEQRFAAETHYNDYDGTDDEAGGESASQNDNLAARMCRSLSKGHRDEARIEFLVLFSPSILVSESDINTILDAVCGRPAAEALPDGAF
jgi:hypothetical protein